MIWLVPLLLLLFPSALAAQSKVTLDASPRVTNVQGYSRLKARIDVDESNRQLEIRWCHDEVFCNKKFFQIQGAQRQRTFEFLVKLEEAGEWEARAILTKSDGSTSGAVTTIRVIGFESE